MSALLDSLFENAEESAILPKEQVVASTPISHPYAYLPVLIYLVYAGVFIYRTTQSYREGNNSLGYTLMAAATIAVILWVIIYSASHGQTTLAWFLCLAPFIFAGLRYGVAWLTGKKPGTST